MTSRHNYFGMRLKIILKEALGPRGRPKIGVHPIIIIKTKTMPSQEGFTTVYTFVQNGQEYSSVSLEESKWEERTLEEKIQLALSNSELPPGQYCLGQLNGDYTLTRVSSSAIVKKN